MYKLKHAVVLAAALAVCGCISEPSSTPKPQPSVVSVGDLAQATRGTTSFALMPDGQIVPPDPRINTEEIHDEIRATIRSMIVARGYEFATPDKADRWIGYAAALEASLNDQQIQALVGFTPGAATGSGLERGTVLLGISNANSRALTWSAGLQAEADPTASAIQRRQNVNTAIERLLADLPRR